MSNFNREMLILARESREFTQTELGDKCGAQQGTISKIESGVLSPSEALIQKFSQVLRYDVEFFNQSDRVYGFNSTVFFHRKRQSLPDKALKRLHATMNVIRMRVTRLLRSAEMADCTFRQLMPEEYGGNIEKIAQLVRGMWQLPSGPVRNVTSAIEDAGGVIAFLDFGTKQADAISEWVPPSPPIFLVNSNAEIPGDRIRLTLAHELGHVIMHRFPSPTMEDEANRFASEFLMPRRDIKPQLFGLTMGKLADMKREWGVSMQAIVMHAHRLGALTDSQRKYTFINFGRSGYRTHEPVEIPIERPSLLDELIALHRAKLGYSDGDLAKLLLMADPRQIREEVQQERALRLVMGG